MFQLISVAEQTGLNLTLLEAQKTGFLVWQPILKSDSENLENH